MSPPDLGVIRSGDDASEILGGRLLGVAGGVEIDEIEFIESDPAAFGAPLTPNPRRDRRVSTRTKVAGALGACAVLTASALVWQPWQGDPKPPWSHRLLVDLPTSRVITASVEQPRLNDGVVGEIYADPDATLPAINAPEGRSAMWVSYPANDFRGVDWTPVSAVIPQRIQGATAAMWGGGAQAATLHFGPVEGRIFELTTNGLTRAELVALAEALSVERGLAQLSDPASALGMDRVSTYTEYAAMLEVLQPNAYEARGAAATSVVMAGSMTGVVTVASLPRSDHQSATRMAELILGETTSRRVHGTTAISAEVSDLDGTNRAAHLVAWHERGRFIVVSGPADEVDTLRLAESTRELTVADWSVVAANVNPNRIQTAAAIGFRTNADGSVVDLWAVTTEDRTQLMLCASTDSEEACTFESVAELPVMALTTVEELPLLFAVVESDAVGPEMHVIHADGEVDAHILFQPSWGIPGPAVAIYLPDDFKSAELLVDGKVVATLK